jgi:hypothetical protein
LSQAGRQCSHHLPTAGLKQPSLRRMQDQTLGRRYAAPVQSTKARPGPQSFSQRRDWPSCTQVRPWVARPPAWHASPTSRPGRARSGRQLQFAATELVGQRAHGPSFLAEGVQQPDEPGTGRACQLSRRTTTTSIRCRNASRCSVAGWLRATPRRRRPSFAGRR